MQSTCRPTVYTEDLYTWPTQAHSEDDCGFELINTVVLAILGFLSAVRPKVDVRNHLLTLLIPHILINICLTNNFSRSDLIIFIETFLYMSRRYCLSNRPLTRTHEDNTGMITSLSFPIDNNRIKEHSEHHNTLSVFLQRVLQQTYSSWYRCLVVYKGIQAVIL